MKRENKIHIIYGFIMSIFGVISVYSLLRAAFYESSTPEIRFWLFMTNTFFLATCLMIPVGWLLDKKLYPSENEKTKGKEPWTKIDYFIMCILNGGFVLMSITLIGFAYVSILIPYETYKNYSIFNIPFLTIVNILFYLSICLIFIGVILIFIFRVKKEETWRKRYELKKKVQNDTQIDIEKHNNLK